MRRLFVFVAAVCLCAFLFAENDVRARYASALELQFSGDYYGAVEAYIGILADAPDYSDVMVALAECYDGVGEYAQALEWVKKARKYRASDTRLAVLESFVNIGLKDLKGAEEGFRNVLAKEPNSVDARFGLALLDLSKGRPAQAGERYLEALAISPENAKALLSLAVIYREQGNLAASRGMIERALRFHGHESRTQYFAGLIAQGEGETAKAITYCETALAIDSRNSDARFLLARLKYALGDFGYSERLMKDAIGANRKDAAAWFTLALARDAQGRHDEAIQSLKTCLALKSDDELVRVALENILIDTKDSEDTSRESLADFHFERAGAFESRSFFDQALFEFRRGLLVYPYSKKGRMGYAELLKKTGFKASYLAELEFLDSLGKADTKVKDAIEIYRSLLRDGVQSAWKIDQFSIRKPRYSVAFFTLSRSGTQYHTDGNAITARYLSELALNGSLIEALRVSPVVESFTEAFRTAREKECDFFFMIKVDETERDFRSSCELHSAKSGTKLGSFDAYRSGNDRLKNTASRVYSLLENSMPFRATLLMRNQNSGLIDRGTVDGIKKGDRFTVLKKGALSLKAEALGFTWDERDAIGSAEVIAIDEEISEVKLAKTGFFDRINPGDEIVAVPEKKKETTGTDANYPGVYETVKKISQGGQ